MAITAVGELFSLLFYITIIRKSKKSLREKSNGSFPAKPILRIAVPSAGSKLFGTFTWFLEPIVFLKALTVSGLTAAAATLYTELFQVSIFLYYYFQHLFQMH